MNLLFNHNEIIEQIHNTLDVKPNTSIRLKRMVHGVANSVYKFSIGNSENVIKIYHREFDSKLSSNLLNWCSKVGIPVPPLISINDNIAIYRYSQGTHKYVLDNEMIANLSVIINRIHSFPIDEVSGKNLIEKIRVYYDYLINISPKIIPNKVCNKILSHYENITSKKEIHSDGLYVLHGDISPTNVLWVNKKIASVLDFDECSIGPRMYDVAVTACKFSLGCHNTINKNYIDHFFSIFLKCSSHISSKTEINPFIDLYIMKVLLEKFFLIETHQIDCNSKRQKTDPWQKWANYIIEGDV
ncbi:phosphotransferase [Paenibacillus illinoisensis]|uniref:phosphotransferase n=1 Tax=Paenibacillus illinoisensis TaxID=59845 RepID=UPI00301A351B